MIRASTTLAPREAIVRVFTVLLAFGLWGCQSDNSYELVRQQASKDLRCPLDQVEVNYRGALSSSCPSYDTSCRDREESSYLLLAQGCGAARIYRCDSSRDTTFGNTHATCVASSQTQQM